VEYLQPFHFINHKFGKLNCGTDALLRRHLPLFQIDAYIRGFEHLKFLYVDDEDLRSFTKNVKGIPKGTSWSKKDICSMGPACVSQSVALVS